MALTKKEEETRRRVLKFSEARLLTMPATNKSLPSPKLSVNRDAMHAYIVGTDLKLIDENTSLELAGRVWLDMHQVSSNTELGYKLVLRKYVEYHKSLSMNPDEIIKLDSLAADKVQEFISWRSVTVSLHSGRAARICLKAFASWLGKHTQFKCDLSSIEGIKNLPERNRLSKSQIHALLEAAGETTNAGRDKPLISFVLGTGLRLNEIRELLISDLNFADEFITVRGATAKNHKKREVRMFPDVADIMRLYLHKYRADAKPTDYVWITQSGQMFSIGGLGGVLRSIKTRAKISDRVGYHSLRHAYASNATEQNMPILDLMTELGHSSVVTTSRYASRRPVGERAKIASPLAIALATSTRNQVPAGRQTDELPLHANSQPLHAEPKKRIKFTANKSKKTSKR